MSRSMSGVSRVQVY